MVILQFLQFASCENLVEPVLSFGPCCLFLHVQAAVKALETAKDLGHKTLEIKTDSRYTINGKDQIYVACCFFFFSCQ